MITTYIYRNSKIESYEGERPSRRNYGETPPPFSKDSGYNSDVEKWRNSKKEYPFAEGEEAKLQSNLFSGQPEGKDDPFILKEIEKGISVTGLVKIKTKCCGRCDGVNDECDSKMFAYFLSPFIRFRITIKISN